MEIANESTTDTNVGFIQIFSGMLADIECRGQEILSAVFEIRVE